MICELITGEFQFSTTLKHVSDKFDGIKSEDALLIDNGVSYKILNCGFGELKEEFNFKIYTERV